MHQEKSLSDDHSQLKSQLAAMQKNAEPGCKIIIIIIISLLIFYNRQLLSTEVHFTRNGWALCVDKW